MDDTAGHDLPDRPAGAGLGPRDFDALRVGYGTNPRLEPADLADGWFPLFSRWLSEVTGRGVREPNAMVLATVGADGRPSTRTVLCKGADARGVTFFTTLTSRKGRQIADTGVASVTFPWLDAERQVHLEGPCAPVDRAEALEYWATRPRGSQIAAWASDESQPIADTAALDRALDRTEERFTTTDRIPMPERWGGYRITVRRAEFWQGGADRFHDRLECDLRDKGWRIRRLQP